MSSSPIHLTGPAEVKPEREGLPFVPVLIALLVIGLIAAFAYQMMAPNAVGTASIVKLHAIEMPPGDRVLVEVEFSIKNTSDKPLKYHSTELKLATDKEEFKDEPASSGEVPRIYASYPTLKQSNASPLRQDTMIAPGQTVQGVGIVAFPVSKAAFDGRKSFEAAVYFYDQSPIRAKK